VIPLALMKEWMVQPPGGTTPSLTNVAKSTDRRQNDFELEVGPSKRYLTESNGIVNRCTAH
jgi:hypothetical protein